MGLGCFVFNYPLRTVGYTMRDIRYKWNEGPNSVGVSSEVSLPQFKVLGHRQRAMEISLTTGTLVRQISTKDNTDDNNTITWYTGHKATDLFTSCFVLMHIIPVH